MTENKHNICLITSPRVKASLTPLSNMIDLLHHLSNQLYVITGNIELPKYKNINSIHIDSINHRSNKILWFSIFSHLPLQLKVSYKMFKLSKSVDIFLFFMAECFFLPMVTSKLLRKPTVLCLASSAIKELESNKFSYIQSKIIYYSEKANYSLSDYIVLYSKNLIQEWDLDKYEHKILIGHKHFLDFSKFKVPESNENTQCIVGYIGRFSGEKGVLNFVESIPLILKEMSQVNFLLIGEGHLKKQIQLFIENNNLAEKVKLMDWVSYEDIPINLSKCKLVVVPSSIEGLPNVVLESMACGTPVLATPVGSIPYIIIDEITGFIMNDNSPECIAKNIVRAINFHELDGVSKNAMKFVENNFTFDVAIKNYNEILCKACK